MTTFLSLNLNSEINKAIAQCGYTKPTPIQAQCIPPILNKKDVIVSAHTGSGKTAAFILPALHHLSSTSSTSKVRILVLTPTRELANQITDAAHKYGKFLKFNIVSLVGGTSYQKQFKNLSRRVDIIIATPGRLLDHVKNHRLDLSAIEMLILDEADRMLDMGFFEDVKKIANITSKDRQTLLFSATLTDKIANLFQKFLKNPVWINLSEQQLVPTHIKQELYITDNVQHKHRLLKHFLTEKNIYKAIIFMATKINADKLAHELSKQGHLAAPLHSDLKQNVRNRTIELFRSGKIQYLIATDVAARGIDINDVSLVINFDLPRFSEDYIHRIGRTGRAGQEGLAISFALPCDLIYLKKIESHITQAIKREVISGMEHTVSGDVDSKKAKSSRNYSHKSKHKSRSNDNYESSSSRSHKPLGPHKTFSDRQSPGGRKTFGERKTFSGDRKGEGERRTFSKRQGPEDRQGGGLGARKPFSERRGTNEDRRGASSVGRHSFNERRGPEERKFVGPSQKPPYKERQAFGDRGNKFSSDRPSGGFNGRKPSFKGPKKELGGRGGGQGARNKPSFTKKRDEGSSTRTSGEPKPFNGNSRKTLTRGDFRGRTSGFIE